MKDKSVIWGDLEYKSKTIIHQAACTALKGWGHLSIRYPGLQVPAGGGSGDGGIDCTGGGIG